jgi:hypothetical protein
MSVSLCLKAESKYKFERDECAEGGRT